jgi:outer membrane protein OmpA-like peptidoglycan-associated protein
MWSRQSIAAGVVGVAVMAATGGCSLITVQQDPFPPLVIRVERPAPPPARVVLTPSSIKISDKVQFQFGSAELDPVSFPLLDEVAAMMVANPQIELLQVEGHTDSVGSDAANKKLSQQRAESVKKYLASKGVEAKRLAAKGFGEEKPLAQETDPNGADVNRRVEFNILKQGPKKTVVQED